jgi:hypothetical protein
VNILVTGRGTSGSWKIRGEQLGAAIGATVLPRALDIGAFDLVVMVKRPGAEIVARAKAARVPLVWDVVDSWPQPEGNQWSEAQARSWLRDQVRIWKPSAIVAATNAMAADCEEFGIPVLALPHHGRPGIERNPIRDEVRTVGYEGSPRYIDGWSRTLNAECGRRGWRFVVNPPRLCDVDIVVALRDATGYAARRWKSNVKLANAQASGTPFVGCREAGYMERSIGGAEKWADTPQELKEAFDALASVKERRRIAGWMISAAPQLRDVAATYREWLSCMR